MKSSLKAIDERVWLLCENGWTPPTVIANNITSLKPVSAWTEDDYKMSNFNSRGLSAISGAVTPDEFHRIMMCTTSKEVWDLLKLTHEGTNTVKESKLNAQDTFKYSASIHLNKCIFTGILFKPTSIKANSAKRVVIITHVQVIIWAPLTPTFLPNKPEIIDPNIGKPRIARYIIYFL